MKKNPYFINIILIGWMGILCLIYVLVKTFSPGTVLSPLSIPFLVAVSIAALMTEYYLKKEGERPRFISAIFAGLTFTVLPMAMGWHISSPVWKLFIIGTIVFFVTDTLYCSIGKRISSGRASIVSPFANGFILYLASQCFQGLLS